MTTSNTSTQSSSSSTAHTESAVTRLAAPNWLREPLLHFVLLGGALFAIDHVVASRNEDPRSIVMGAEVDREARQTFAAARGREPNTEELTALRRVWLDNEVLYREGLAMQVDKGDTAIRERVIFKALSVVDSNTQRQVPDAEILRAWFEKNRGRYDEPQRFDFQEAVLTSDATEANTRAFVDALNRGAPGDAKAGLRVFKGRPHSNIVQSYGAEFAKSLEESTAGEWRAMVTREGWRAMRLDQISAAKPANWDSLRGVVLQDWTDATMAEQRTAAVRTLAQKYSVKTAATTP